MQAIKFYTLGCKVNQYETQSLRERFLSSGFRELDDGRPADIYLINTCTVTHKADRESLQLIRRAKKENPKARVIVTGCLAEQDAERIKRAAQDCLIIRNQDKPSGGISYFKNHTRVFLKIQDGCNNRCSYCKVPLVRGTSKSRPLNEIISEAQRLVKNGYKEIVLTGICLGAYTPCLTDVISALEEIGGLLRIRLSSIEAGDVSDKLIKKMAASDKLCPHLHIPVQSGDDEILRKMNRNYRRRDYLGLIRRVKKSVPEVAITTDVIVGFPGESEANFKNTVDLIKQIQPLRTHIFGYSPRQGTAACGLPGKTGVQEIKKRICRLNNVARQCARAYQRRFFNRKMAVLVEGSSKGMPGFWEGYTGNYIKVLVNSERELQNQYILVELDEIKDDSKKDLIFM